MKIEKIIEDGIEYTVKTNDDGDQMWYWKDQLHRDNGSARNWSNGSQQWYQHGKLHREDGPAVIFTDGTQGWHYQDKYIANNQEEFNQWLKLKAFQ